MSQDVSIDAVLSGQELVGPRFEKHVLRGADCWDWTGGCSVNGYGRFWEAGKYHQAHRAAYQSVHGLLPTGIYVCHHCDNRKCVRPDHLFAGTHADNMADMVAKGRAASIGTPHPGESNPQAVLSERDVELIRKLVFAGVPQKVVAGVFGVGVTAVSAIIRGRRWNTV